MFHHVIPTPIRVTLIGAISLAVIVTNLLNLIVLVRLKKRLPAFARTLFLNLSISDLTVGLVSCLPCVYPAVTLTWPYGDIWCQIAGTLHGTSVTVSIWSIALISLDRCIAIINPLKYKAFSAAKYGYICVAASWFGALVTFIAPVFTTDDFMYYRYNVDEVICGLHWEYPEFCLATGLYIPVLSGTVLVVTIALISRRLKKVAVAHANMTSDHASSANVKMNKTVMKTTCLTASAYFTLWGPYVVAVMLRAVIRGFYIHPAAMFSFLWVGNANSFLNVFIYSATNRRFREEARNIFRRGGSSNQVSGISTANAEATNS